MGLVLATNWIYSHRGLAAHNFLWSSRHLTCLARPNMTSTSTKRIHPLFDNPRSNEHGRRDPLFINRPDATSAMFRYCAGIPEYCFQTQVGRR